MTFRDHFVTSLLVFTFGCHHSGSGTAGDAGNSGVDGGQRDGGGLDSAVNLDGGAGDGFFVDFDAACASSSVTADRLPADLVFMFDRSSSMNDPDKWAPCATGLEAFFSDTTSTGLSASLQFFCGGGNAQACQSLTTQWTTPAVALSSLPQSTIFTNAINAQSFCSGTPTNAALEAAIAYAQMIETPGHKTAIVLVTDGLPTKCGSLATVVQTAMSVAATIPTYVIGVGSATGNLDMIAAGGGTGQAILVATNNPMQVAQDFETALDAIRGQAVSCSYTIPSPPPGQTLDYTAVNVVLTTMGMAGTLAYDENCTSSGGWHYDDPAMPTQILLCPNACNIAKSDSQSSVQVLFGCATVIS